jgi:hypothetical protein
VPTKYSTYAVTHLRLLRRSDHILDRFLSSADLAEQPRLLLTLADVHDRLHTVRACCGSRCLLHVVSNPLS